jgi:hypothetical protein
MVAYMLTEGKSLLIRVMYQDVATFSTGNGKFQARPEANLQNVAVDRSQQLLPMLCQERPAHEEVA